MGLPEIIELGGLALLAATKFAMAAGLLASPITNYSYLDSVLILIISGFIGVIFFFFFSNWVNKMVDKYFNKKKKKQKFSKKTRRFISIKNKYGLLGVSFLTPILLSIPLGCFIASRFFYKQKHTLIIMLAGVVFWSLMLPLIMLLY
jgi:hypothetical protein